MANAYWSPDRPAGDHDDVEHLRAHFDPLSRDLTRGRYTRVARTMARECPVSHTDRFGDGLWTVSGYDALVAVHRDEGEVYSNFPVLLQSFGQVRPMIPMESDPPLHRQYKQIIAAPLSRREQQAREPYYRDLVRRQVAGFLDAGCAELFEQLCTPVTVHALMDTLGVPEPDRERLADLAVRLVRGQAEDGAPAVAIYEYFSGLAAAKRADPGDDVVSLLCRAEVDGRPLTETEILDYCLILLPAGFETTASSMSFMFLMLAEDRELQDLLRAEPERIPTALEELMRYVTPTRSHTRTVLADTTLDGRTLRRGERVYLNWAGANHDPAVFDHPEELRIDRSPNRHMAYGYGAHTCVGLHMARTELKVAFEEVLAALDDIRLTDPDDVHEDIGTTWAITHLPVTFTRRPPGRATPRPTSTRRPEALDDVDISRPNGARVYDFLLGGAHNFAVDREHAEKLLAANPEQQDGARANRAFLRRVVEWCLEQGVDQFLDLGSGVPTVGNVHEIVRRHRPDARVAYVDRDPVAVAHSESVVGELDTVTVTRADLRDPDDVLAAPGVADLLDLARPVALLAVACLHFVPGDASGFMADYRSRLAPGSVVAISHGSDDVDDPDHAARMRAVADSFADTASPVTLRSRDELRALVGDFSVVDPGIVDITAWPTPSTDVRPAATWAVVAVRR